MTRARSHSQAPDVPGLPGVPRALGPAVLLGVAVAVGLAGCVSIPTSGPIESGEVVITEPAALIALANDPDPGAGPDQIIGGFLSAVDAGLYDEFQTARKYLTLPASSRWDPRARVVVYEGGVPEVEEQDDGTYLVSVPVAAVLDRGGRYEEAPPSTREVLTMEVEESATGEWRVSTPPDGVLVSTPTFEQIYRRTPVYFASRDRTHLVPDVRWFPSRYQATSAVEALLSGPSPWLRDVVDTGAPEGARLSATAVTVTRGVAQVDLTSQGRPGSPADRALLQAQLEATLERLPGVLVNEVQVTVGGVATETPLVPELVRDPTPDSGPYLVTDEGLAVLDTGGVRLLPDAPDLADLEVGALAVTPDGRVRAALDGGRRVVLLPADGSAPRVLHEGRALVAPTADRSGWVWSGERSSAGSLTAVRATGTLAEVTAEWLDGRTVHAVRVARDGARVAVVSSSGPDAATTLDVAAVVRAEDGTPRMLGAPLTLGPAVTEVTQVRWLDESTLVVLAGSGSGAAPVVVPIGGPVRALGGVPGTVAIASGRGERSLYLLTDDGELHVRQNQGWALVAEDVLAVDTPG